MTRKHFIALGPRYVRIIVHEDVLDTARDIIARAFESGRIDSEDARALWDLTDPLDEPDVYGNVPTVEQHATPKAAPR